MTEADIYTSLVTYYRALNSTLAIVTAITAIALGETANRLIKAIKEDKTYFGPGNKVVGSSMLSMFCIAFLIATAIFVARAIAPEAQAYEELLKLIKEATDAS